MSNIYKFNISDIQNINLLPSNTLDTPYFIEVQDVNNIANINNKLKSLNRYVAILFKNNVTCTVLDLNNVFNSCDKLVSIDASPFINATNTSFMFAECTNLKFVKNCKFNKTINANGMFINCTSLQYIDWLDENFKSATNTDTMFKNCSALTNIINLSDFSASTSATEMFTGCTSLKKVNYLEETKGILLASIPSSVEKKLNKVNYIKFITTETLKEFVKKAKEQIDLIAGKITNLNSNYTNSNNNYNAKLNDYNTRNAAVEGIKTDLNTAETNYTQLVNLVDATSTAKDARQAEYDTAYDVYLTKDQELSDQVGVLGNEQSNADSIKTSIELRGDVYDTAKESGKTLSDANEASKNSLESCRAASSELNSIADKLKTAETDYSSVLNDYTTKNTNFDTFKQSESYLDFIALKPTYVTYKTEDKDQIRVYANLTDYKTEGNTFEHYDG